MRKVRFNYVGNCGQGQGYLKSFRSLAQMKEWAKDEAHDGKYYISFPGLTVIKAREEILVY